MDEYNSLSKIPMKQPSPHSIFRESTDYYNWDKYLEQLALIELSRPNKKRAKDALIYLRSIFGEKFLKKCFRSSHPLRYEFTNSAPIARLRLIRLADSLRSMAGLQGFDGIFERLLRAHQYAEAATVIETASEFRSMGFTIVFEPHVDIFSRLGKVTTKYPDLMILNPKTGERVFVEVSRLRQSVGQIRSENTFHTIWGLLFQAMNDSSTIEVDEETKTAVFHHILPFANIYQDFEGKELIDVVGKIKVLVKKVHLSNKFQELAITDKIEVAISPRDDHTKAKKWAKMRGIDDLVQGPPIPLHETHRTRVKIGTKIRQLPPESPGIIVIPTTDTLMFFTYGAADIVRDIESELLKYPQLLCVVLSSQAGESGAGPTKAVAVGNHLSVARTREDLVTERKIIISNPDFKLQISTSTLDMIRHSFLRA